METKSKSEYIKSWKSELDNLKTIFCSQKLKIKLNRHIKEIEYIIELIAEQKKLPEE